MGSISERDRILLGYAPLDPFGVAVTRSQRRNSDADFLDVFGGPPSRSSSRRSREDSSGPRLSRLGSGEKPVFGDLGSSSRRQQLGDDFYGDIFQISESSCSSPRRGDRDPLMSSSSSRTSSPSRPTPSWLEPLFGGSSFRTQPRSEDGGSDVFSYPLFPNASSSVFFTTQSVASHGDLKNNDHGSCRRSPLSHPSLRGFEGLSEASEPAFQTVESQTGKSSSCSLEDYIHNRQFHFSIYKWAGKGVMLVMPSDSNEENEVGGFTRLPEVIVQELELPTHCDYFSSVSKPSKSGTVIQENKWDKMADDYAGTTAKILHAMSGLELLKGVTNKTSVTDKYGNQSENGSVSGFDKKCTTDGTNEKQNPESCVNVHYKRNPELKSVSQLLDDAIEKQRSHDRQINEREAQSKSQKKQQLLRESKLVHGEDNITTLPDILSFEDKPRGSKVKGKVKEFIKKFNQEAPPKRKGAFEILNRRSKIEDTRQDKVDELAHVSSIETDKMREGNGNKGIPLFDIPNVMENQLMEKAEGKAGISYNDHIIDNHPSEVRVEVLHSQYEPIPEDLKACYEEIILEDMEYLVQQLPPNQTEAVQKSLQEVQIKNLGANIRQWSKGKEGNIRSLLSTLHLVLWPDSGWKQVPLVHIIEGPSVKKAYQKALLCLHPDKLQQKGASWEQKYIAEKVFDILQEAWDHFNSISQF